MIVQLIRKHKGLRRHKQYQAIPKGDYGWDVIDHQKHSIRVPTEKLIAVVEESHFPLQDYSEEAQQLIRQAKDAGYVITRKVGSTFSEIEEDHVLDPTEVYASTGKPTERAKLCNKKAIQRRIKELLNQVKTLQEQLK